jgi:membrane protein YdbS with pleckstrin-like domain
MALQCNIDSRGRAARLVYGVVLVVAGAVMALTWARHNDSPWPWVATAAVIAAGAFAVFEARAGWCAVRAMGFKTPI